MKNFPEIILSYYKKEPKGRLKIKQLAQKLHISQSDYPAFRDSVKQLAHSGKLYRFKGNCYGLSGQVGEVIGTFDIHPRGFGFVHTPDEKKIHISEDNIANACHGDTVAVVIHRKRRHDRDLEGHIKRVVTRGKNEFICIYHKLHGYSLGIPAIFHLRSEIIIEDMNDLSPQEGEYIMVEIITWKTGGQRHLGRLKSIVGKENTSEFDAIFVANKHNIPDAFSPETIKQVDKIVFKIPDDPHRKDLRDIPCFTIDPDDAKDFDDAVSIKMTQEGNYLLGVHIADVSHYVPLSTPLDDDAIARGTSVYFTNQVIHMLPEKLSTILCSLQPNTDRLAMTAIMTVSNKGECLSYEIMPSVIHSRQRFTYKDVQDILDRGEGAFYTELSTMSKLAKILKKKRVDEGSIDFDLPEP
ncbi:MAG: RNB domain-containing ribonuclease, partial [Candidatus Marinimicrobia bacterium]|nr:RNB domain-containing ribonuclease [Candidatus Neomarinimicrobiota bacterium]